MFCDIIVIMFVKVSRKAAKVSFYVVSSRNRMLRIFGVKERRDGGNLISTARRVAGHISLRSMGLVTVACTVNSKVGRVLPAGGIGSEKVLSVGKTKGIAKKKASIFSRLRSLSVSSVVVPKLRGSSASLGRLFGTTCSRRTDPRGIDVYCGNLGRAK